MKNPFISIMLGVALALSFSAQAAPINTAEKAADLQLWRLDCGTLLINDLQLFSDTFNYKSESKKLTNSCYLIRHNETLMLWDTGLSTDFLNAPFTTDIASPTLTQTLTDQLNQINIKADDIDLIGISHYHFDHVGQAAQFAKAKLLIGEKDFAALKQTPLPLAAEPKRLAPWIDGNGEVDLISGDRDIFGDGTVIMLNMPGHTPGSHALLVRLPNTGSVLLSGDIVHFNEQHADHNVPPDNTDRAQSLASISRLNGIAKDMPATLIIQHEPEHIKRLPAFPKSAR